MYDNSDSNFPRVGTVTISGAAYPAEQQAPDGNFRKRATRFFKDGKWTEWCCDDHDLFTPYYLEGGRWEPFRLPAGAEFPEPMKFATWEKGGRFIDALKKDLRTGRATLYAGPVGTWPLPWCDPWHGAGDAEWTRLCLVHCEDWDGNTGTTKKEAVGNANPRPVYLMHVHWAPGAMMSDHPPLFTPVHAVVTPA